MEVGVVFVRPGDVGDDAIDNRRLALLLPAPTRRGEWNRKGLEIIFIKLMMDFPDGLLNGAVAPLLLLWFSSLFGGENDCLLPNFSITAPKSVDREVFLVGVIVALELEFWSKFPSSVVRLLAWNDELLFVEPTSPSPSSRVEFWESF